MHGRILHHQPPTSGVEDVASISTTLIHALDYNARRFARLPQPRVVVSVERLQPDPASQIGHGPENGPRPVLVWQARRDGLAAADTAPRTARRTTRPEPNHAD
jgi:hypothetical protein